MKSSYEDLSRRALIKLAHDYDAENNNSLQDYLDGNKESYEEIRPLEIIIDKVDSVKNIIGASSSKLAKTAFDTIDKTLDAVVNSMGMVLDLGTKV